MNILVTNSLSSKIHKMSPDHCMDSFNSNLYVVGGDELIDANDEAEVFTHDTESIETLRMMYGEHGNIHASFIILATIHRRLDMVTWLLGTGACDDHISDALRHSMNCGFDEISDVLVQAARVRSKRVTRTVSERALPSKTAHVSRLAKFLRKFCLYTGK